MNDENIIVASLMKMLGENKIHISELMVDSIKSYVIVHVNYNDSNGKKSYTLEYKEGDE